MLSAESPCCCDSGRCFADCCGPYIKGESSPQTAEQLMRSRYSAYFMQDSAYLRKTWHESTRPTTLNFDSNIRWIGLTIKNSQAGRDCDDVGTIEFVARYKINGRAHRLHEVSNFIKQAAHWFYVDGTAA